MFNDFVVVRINKIGSLKTSLLCIVGELEGGGSVALAVGANDTSDRLHLIDDMIHLTCDTGF